MKRRCWVVIAALILVTPLVAGPIFSKPKEIPDEVRCLADLKKFSVVVLPMPEEVAPYVSTNRVKNQINSMLEQAGFEILEDDTALPQCVVRVNAAIDPAQPNSLSVYAILAVRQKVLVHRIDQTLSIPTTSVHGVILTTRDRLKSELDKHMMSMVNLLVRTVRAATRHQN